ncbi:MAG: potassium channel family protein [Desulfopila sp.]
MLVKIAITIAMIVLTTAVHAGGMMGSLWVMRWHDRQRRAHWYLHPVFRVSGIVVVMFGISLVESCFWALSYVLLGAIDSLEAAVYFSMVTYTTLGYGDVVLGPNWRLLASFEAANGIVMFGWTTAIVMAAIRHIYLEEEHITRVG